MAYDLKIINGRIFDARTKQVREGSVCIRNGKFAKEQPGEEASFTVDAGGDYVLPGLIDEHVHINYLNSNIGLNADLVCLPMGVTTAVDPGSTGWTNFDGYYYNNVLRYKTHAYAYLHVSPHGVFALNGSPESSDPKDYNEQQILNKVKQYPDVIRGLKLRMNEAILRGRGLAPLQRALEIAMHLEEKTGRRYLLEVHFDSLPADVRITDILQMLRPGDILLHVFQMKGETIFDGNGQVKEAVRAAQERGVLMDDSHGRMLWSFDHLKKAVACGFMPDIISSDVVHPCEYMPPACNLLHAMNVDLAAGMQAADILQAVTFNPAKALGLSDRAGVIEEGRNADVCVMKLADCDRTYRDWWGGSCTARKVFVPVMTLVDGEIVYRQTWV